MTNFLQVSGKCGDVIVVIGGNDPAQFQDNLLAVLGEDGAASVADAFRAALVGGVETAIMTRAATAVMDAGLAAPGPLYGNAPHDAAQAAVTRPSVPSSPPADAVREETDKWGSHWTYQVPGAPSCAHGPTVQKKATSKAGKPYTMWACPTATPFAFRQKIAKADCDGGGFAR